MSFLNLSTDVCLQVCPAAQARPFFFNSLRTHLRFMDQLSWAEPRVQRYAILVTNTTLNSKLWFSYAGYQQRLESPVYCTFLTDNWGYKVWVPAFVRVICTGVYITISTGIRIRLTDFSSGARERLFQSVISLWVYCCNLEGRRSNSVLMQYLRISLAFLPSPISSPGTSKPWPFTSTNYPRFGFH